MINKKIFLLIFILLIAESFSLTIECKLKGDQCTVNSVLKITNSNIEITDIKNNHDYKVLLFKNAKILFLPLGLGKNFPHMENLMVKNSSLQEVTKNVFENLGNLTEINLSENLLKNLPADVFEDLKNLTKIYLEKNQISNLPSTIFKFNLKLIEISLAENKLQTLHDATFKNLKNLLRIFLTGNQLEDLHSGTFDDNEKLSVVNVKRNFLKYIPEDIFDKNLELKFHKNYFMDNKCIDSSKNPEKREDFVEIFRESCKPINFELIKELREKLEVSEKKLAAAETALTSKNEEIEKFERKISKNEENIKEKSEKISELDEKIEKMEKKFQNEKSELEEKIKNLKNEFDNSQNISEDFKAKNSELHKNFTIQLEKIENKTEKIKQQDLEIGRLTIMWSSCENDLRKINLEKLNLDQEFKKINEKNSKLGENLSKAEKALQEKIESCRDLETRVEEMRQKIAVNEMTMGMYLNYIKNANDTIDEMKSGKCGKILKSARSEVKVLDTQKSSIEIPCKFSIFDYKLGGGSKFGTFYTCEVDNFMALDCSSIPGDFQGNHIELNKNDDVTGVTITSSTFTEFPVKIFEKSSKNFIKIYDSGFGKVEKICDRKTKYLIVSKSFLGGDSIKIDCENLIHLNIENSNLKKVELENLKFLTDLSLKNNEIEEIPLNFFSSLKLKIKFHNSKENFLFKIKSLKL